MNCISNKYFFLIALTICLTSALSAQVNRSNVKGILVDESGMPIPGATLMVLNAADSVLTEFGSSETDGSFIIRNIPKGEYIINITFLGLASLYKPLTTGTAEEIDLGKITMKASN